MPPIALALTVLTFPLVLATWQYNETIIVQEYRKQGTWTTVATLATLDCKGLCSGKAKIAILGSSFQCLNGWFWGRDPFVCFKEDQVRTSCNLWPETYGGCAYRDCRVHSTDGRYLWITLDKAEDPKWEKGVKGKVYVNMLHSGPVGDIIVFKKRELYLGLHHLKTVQETIENTEPAVDKPGTPFSWITLIQEGAALLNLSSPENFTDCFLCASLSKPPLIAVQVNATPSETASSSPDWYTGPVTVPLYENQGEESYLNSSDWCKEKKTTTLRPPNGLFFWANQTLTPKINCSDTQVYILVALAPQLLAYPPGELEAKYVGSTLRKRAVFLPVLVGLRFAAFVAGISVGGASLATSLQSQDAIRQELHQALSSVATSMASLQRQILSLARVAQQNCQALDLLTADKGGTCIFLGEECCYFVNESGLVEENIQRINELKNRLKPSSGNGPTSWWQDTLFSFLAPILGSVIVLILIIMIGPWAIRTVVRQLESTLVRKATSRILILQQQQEQRTPLLAAETDRSAA